MSKIISISLPEYLLEQYVPKHRSRSQFIQEAIIKFFDYEYGCQDTKTKVILQQEALINELKEQIKTLKLQLSKAKYVKENKVIEVYE